jgi:hypothetical protein
MSLVKYSERLKLLMMVTCEKDLPLCTTAAITLSYIVYVHCTGDEPIVQVLNLTWQTKQTSVIICSAYLLS